MPRHFKIMPTFDDFPGTMSVGKGLFRSGLAELVATMFFVYVGPGSVIAATNPPVDLGGGMVEAIITSGVNNLTNISLTFGFAIAVLIHNIGHISGGNINPAVTVSLVVTGNLSVVEGIIYVISQLLGAMLGAALLFTSFDDISNSCNAVPPEFTLGEALLLEMFLTALLVFTVMASIDKSNKDAPNAPLSIGLAVAVAHLVAVTATGTSINPARTFGPAVVSNCWDDHWVFWVGPIVGGVVAALFYQLVLAVGVESDDDLKGTFTTDGEGQRMETLAV